MPIQDILNWAVLVGAACMALWNIIKFFSAGDSWFKRKSEEKIKDVLATSIPAYLEKHSKKVSQERTRENETQIKTALAESLKGVYKKLDNIIELNNEQNKTIELLKKDNTGLLRREIKKIYCKYRPYKKILQYDKEDCVKIIEDYFSLDGNSYVEDLWKEMRTWEVVDKIENLEEKK